MASLKEISHHIELHSAQEIREAFAKGLNPNATFEGDSLFNLLLSMYTRSPRFKDCVKAFIDNGLDYEDKVLLAVLADDARELERQLAEKPEELNRQVSLRCAYTPLANVSFLHVCAEYNLPECGKVLVERGINVDSKAETDERGFGGHTPIFHTVNQNNNNSAEMLNFLLSVNADLNITVKGFVWGEGFPWETFIPAVNPISYSMMGLLPQMHRDEKTIANTVRKLIKHSYGIDYLPGNIPNRYLKQ